MNFSDDLTSTRENPYVRKIYVDVSGLRGHIRLHEDINHFLDLKINIFRRNHQAETPVETCSPADLNINILQFFVSECKIFQ